MLKSLSLLAVALFVPFLLSCTGITSAVTDLVISDDQEVAMGQKFAAQINADAAHYPPYKGSADVINYVKSLGQNIVSHQKDRNIAFTFTVLNDTSINAFAIPGGFVYVNIGVLRNASSGAEVAGVIAHEIGHVTMRHGAKQLMKSESISFVNQILFGSDSNSIAAAVSSVVENLVFLKFSRDDENQADSCGVVYSIGAHYNPYGMKNFFQVLMNKYGDGMGAFETLSDHPNTSDRITHVQNLINKTPGAPTSATDTTQTHYYAAEFLAVKAKL
jgi:beta-barrel assembly-enhancing protease